MRDRLRRLERLADGKLITITQQDGTVAKFSTSDLRAAYLNLMTRMRAGGGDEMPPEHPLLEAARNSPDPAWTNSFYSTDGDDTSEHVADLSE